MFKALKSFVGKVSMVEGEIKEIKDEEVIKDLLKAGYIEAVNKKAEEPKVDYKKTSTKKNK